MNIKTVTTFNNKLYNDYAHRFIQTYNWPFDLIVYSEDNVQNLESIQHNNTFTDIPSVENLLIETAIEKYLI